MPAEPRLWAIRTASGEVRAGLGPDGAAAVDVAAASGGALPAHPSALLALEGWADRLAELDLGRGEELAGEAVAPQPLPNKIVAVGLNYVDHSAESGEEQPVRPLLFAKWPNSVVGPDAPIRVPLAMTSQADYEVELAVVIGRTAAAVSEADALGYVGGYTIGNDVSARDVQFADGQWTYGKSFDSFCPLGPAIVPATSVADVQALEISTEVNGEVRQRASTADMVFGVANLIAYISAHVTLLPGDVVLTGTPAGVGLGYDPPRWLGDGDLVSCTVEGVGTLSNPVVME